MSLRGHIKTYRCHATWEVYKQMMWDTSVFAHTSIGNELVAGQPTKPTDLQPSLLASPMQMGSAVCLCKNTTQLRFSCFGVVICFSGPGWFSVISKQKVQRDQSRGFRRDLPQDCFGPHQSDLNSQRDKTCCARLFDMTRARYVVWSCAAITDWRRAKFERRVAC